MREKYKNFNSNWALNLITSPSLNTMSSETHARIGPPRVRAVAPGQQGLYDPRFEHDACGVGFLVNVKGQKSHSIVRQALQILVHLNHRGACGCASNTGDGAGILLQTPHAFLKEVCKEAKVSLPGESEYGVGMLYLPRDAGQQIGKAHV